MKVFRGFQHRDQVPACALTIGNFDGVHRGHQAMLALLRSEAAHRGVPSCVMTFEPHPRDYFARALQKPELAPARIATLRDKLLELERCGVDQVVVVPFDERLARQSPQQFVEEVLLKGLGVRYVLVGDDFRFGAQRAGDYAMLDAAGQQLGFDVARMNSYEVRGLRVSSSAVREALREARMHDVATLLGRPYSISGHVVHGRKLGRELGATCAGAGNGFRTLNLRFSHWKPAASGIFVVEVHGLTPQPLPGVANLGIRPSLDPRDVNGGRVLLETHVLDWPAALGPEELKYDGLDALTKGIAKDCDDARAWWAARHGNDNAQSLRRQTTRDRI
jgi:riboflavin kinase/FMN adenylyltransferase